MSCGVQHAATPQGVFAPNGLMGHVPPPGQSLAVLHGRPSFDPPLHFWHCLPPCHAGLREMPRGGKIRLQPANSRVKPIYLDQDDVRVQGVVIGVLRKY